MLPFVYRVTPYDPAEQDTAVDRSITRIPFDSRERVASAFVAAVAGFALDAGVSHVTLDNPMMEGFFSFSVRTGRGGRGLAGLFPHGNVGYHDGARVPLGTGLGLLRAMVLRQGAWCRLNSDSGFFVHVGDEDDIYVGDNQSRENAVARARALGLSVEQIESSPYDPAFDETGHQQSADGAFWTELGSLVAENSGVLLEEHYVGNAFRWHRLTSAPDIEAAREQLTPRARLAVWPDLTDDTEAVRAAITRQERLDLLVQQYPGGGFHTARIAEPGMGRTDVPSPQLTTGPGHRAALVPLLPADRHPLLAAVLPDADGVLRARWRTNRTRADERRTFMSSLRAGDVVAGVVATGLDDIGVHVHLNNDAGRDLGFLRVPEMSWSSFDSVDDIVPIGRKIRAAVLHIDWAWEQVSLSLKALQPDPWQQYTDIHPIGDTVPGTVTKLLPLGAFIRLGEGVEGLIHITELSGHNVESPEGVIAVGDEVLVDLLDIDRQRRRISLSLKRDHTECEQVPIDGS